MKRAMRIYIFIAVLLLTLSTSASVTAQSQLTGTTAVAANLRAGPDRASLVLFSLPAQTPLQIEARNAASDWLLAHTTSARRGWIQTRQVTLAASSDLNRLPVSALVIGGASTPNAPPAAASVTASGTPVVSDPSALAAFLANPSSYAAQITPEIRTSMRAIYQRGLQLGNNPRVFTKVGDCWTSEYWAFQQFGGGYAYNLGAYGYLQNVIDYYSVSPRAGVANSFTNKSQSAHAGMNVGAEFDPMWADPAVCKSEETPLACEFRVNRPSAMIVMFGVTDVAYFTVEQFGDLMQRVVKEALQQGIVPILSTAPNPSASVLFDRRVKFNNVTRAIARANNLPLIDLDGATANLPDQGVYPDGVHPTPYFRFTRAAFYPDRFREGAVLYDFLSLQSLYNVWSAVLK